MNTITFKAENISVTTKKPITYLVTLKTNNIIWTTKIGDIVAMLHNTDKGQEEWTDELWRTFGCYVRTEADHESGCEKVGMVKIVCESGV